MEPTPAGAPDLRMTAATGGGDQWHRAAPIENNGTGFSQAGGPVPSAPSVRVPLPCLPLVHAARPGTSLTARTPRTSTGRERPRTNDGQTRRPTLTERDWQARVVDLARWHGWRVFHPYESRRSAAGWPDLAMVRDGRLIFAELKSEHGHVSTEQRRWFAALSACAGVGVYVWRPSAWPDVQRLLR